MTTPEFAKASLRRAMKTRRAGLHLASGSAATAKLAGFASTLVRQFAQGARIVSGYVAMRSEIDPAPLMLALAQLGYQTCLPRIEDGNIAFRLWRVGDPLAEGGFGLAEPLQTAPLVGPDVILAPLLAFDRRGGRLGYGAGYYDRAIDRMAPRLVVGLAYAGQEVEAVPMEPHDRRLDMIVTEAGLIDCRAN